MSFSFRNLHALVFTPGWHARRDARHASTLGTVHIPLYIDYQPGLPAAPVPGPTSKPADQEEQHHEQRIAS